MTPEAPQRNRPDRPTRTRPLTTEVTSLITTEAPARSAPSIAPDILEPIDPGRIPGLARDDRADHGDRSGAAGPDAGAPTAISPSLVTEFQSIKGYPCISLLLTTCPGDRMTPDDAARLERLRLNALSRLGAEDLLGAEAQTVAALDRRVQDVIAGPTDVALALYAAAGRAWAVPLPIEVEDRSVVDPTLATRDLVRALHRTPRHVVLVLSGHRAALFDGAGGRLAPAADTHFPMDLRTGRAGEGESLLTALREVDRSLGIYLRLHPAPVVLIGPQKTVSAFRSLSSNLARLAGTVYGGFADASTAELARRTRPVLDRYLGSRQHAALTLLDDRTGARRVASGISAAWLAARAERPEMLVVEESYRCPARLSADGDVVMPAEDVEAPDVIDDLVDELIETVLDRGGWVAIARDGTLADHAGVALTLR